MVDKHSILKKQVEEAVDKLKPYLQADGGDMNVVDLTPDLILLLNLTGACRNCKINSLTIKAVKQFVMRECPEIKDVITVFK